ncbi:MAG TPA: CRTAC1 family protein [Lacunisphaera sp.]|nr:CRTAC1 family protein [Lacunisphaera sp.]
MNLRLPSIMVRRPGVQPGWLAALALLVAVAAGDEPAPKPQPESTRRMVELLATIPRDVDPTIVPYFAAKTAHLVKKKFDAARTVGERASLQWFYATALLNDGQPKDALKALDDLEQFLGEHGLSPKQEDAEKMFLFRAICWLRYGELQNCLTNHNADSCLLPIRGGGVHTDQTGSREAIKVLQEVLDNVPTPYAIWLYNLAYMTLGEYPDKVPEQWRIPPEVFKSDYDIKRFPDVAGPLGLDIDDQSGGVVMDDFDNDGLLDLMVSASGLDSQLRFFHNNGDGTFTERTEQAGLKGLTGGLNLIQADYDNDGFVDVFVLRGGWLGRDGHYPSSLLHNNGDGTFTDVTERAGVLHPGSTQTAVWFDYNGDGRLDLFIAYESQSQAEGDKQPCVLYRNEGDGTFTECAATCGVALTAWFKAVVTGDYNNDGRPDLYLSVFGGPNYLLRNDGPEGGSKDPRAPWRFTNVAESAGVTEPIKSFPSWFFDYDNDGWPDLFVCGYSIKNAGDILADYLGSGPPTSERPRLYHNNHDGTFTDVTKSAGLWKIIEGMGANFGDLDNDGWLDFYIGTGDPILGTLIPNKMFRNNGGASFQDVTTSGGFGQLQKGHGIAFGDLNNDGTQDIYSVVGGALIGDHYPNQLFANPGHGNHWLKLKLEGVQTNRSAIGARIKVVARTATGERAIYRTVGSGGSFGCSPLRQEIGLGSAVAIDRVEITWPVTGKTQVMRGLAPDRCYRVREGDAKAEEQRLPTFAWPAPSSSPMHHHHAPNG